MKKTLILICCALCATMCLVGCSTNKTSNLAKDLDATIKNFVVSVSNLDWPEDAALEKLNNLNKTYEGVTSTQNSSSPDIDTDIDTSEIYTWLEILHSKINIMLSKRSDLLVYINEIHGGNTKLSEFDQLSLKVYMNILKDNSNYLTSYKGMLKNQINEAQNLYNNKSNINAINAYIIKAVETLQVRSAKLDTSILAMNSIIDIIGSNLINNYFKYNEHKITEPKTDVTLPSTPTKPEEPVEDLENDVELEENNNNQNNNPSDTQNPDNNENLDNNSADTDNTENQTPENAIDFDSDTVQVDGENNQNKDNKSNTEESSNLKSDKIEVIDNQNSPSEKMVNNVQSVDTSDNINTTNENNADNASKTSDKKISRETIREKVI